MHATWYDHFKARFSRNDDALTGIGLPEGFDLARAESLGLKIARTLAQSLGGRFTMSAAPIGPGAIARLEIDSHMLEVPAVD